jgi:glutaconate CoA-transferase subunit B
MKAKEYTDNEIMIIAASKYVYDYDVVFAGTGMPLISALFAQKTHAKNIAFVAETGPMAPEVVPTPLSVSDPRLMYKAVKHGSLRDVLGTLLQRGLVDVGFLGGAEIDQFGNINSTVIGDYFKPKIRFPGSGGACDIASHAKRILIITKHRKERFPEKCSYITSPGYIDGPDGRKNAGLRNPYPEIVAVTNLAVMRINPSTGKLQIIKKMPDVTIENILENTGFVPEMAENIETVEKPKQEELNLLRNELDPNKAYI